MPNWQAVQGPQHPVELPGIEQACDGAFVPVRLPDLDSADHAEPGELFAAPLERFKVAVEVQGRRGQCPVRRGEGLEVTVRVEIVGQNDPGCVVRVLSEGDGR